MRSMRMLLSTLWWTLTVPVLPRGESRIILFEQCMETLSVLLLLHLFKIPIWSYIISWWVFKLLILINVFIHRLSCQEAKDDSFALYSTVNKWTQYKSVGWLLYRFSHRHYYLIISLGTVSLTQSFSSFLYFQFICFYSVFLIFWIVNSGTLLLPVS